MSAFKKQLELISLVNNNYGHIQQLESLVDLYSNLQESDYSKEYPSEYSLNQEQINKLIIVTKTTQNSHYDMRLFTQIEFQDECNVIDNVLKDNGIKAIPSFKKDYYNQLIKSQRDIETSH